MPSSSSISRLLLLRRHFSSIPPTTTTLSNASKSQTLAVISLLKSEKDPTRILSIRSLSLPLPPHHLITLFGHAQLLPDALSQFTATISTNKHAATRCLNALLFACILSGNPRQALVFFRDLPARYHIAPNLATYNTLLKAYCQSGSSLSAYSVLDEMSRKRIRPNITTFTIAMAGLYREQRFDQVDRLIAVMRKHGCRPGLSVYNVRIQCLCKLKRVEEAKRMLDKEMRVKRMEPNCVTYGHLILGFCSVGNLEEGLRLYREMGRRGVAPESSCYFTLVHYLCKGGEFESALRVCKESMDRNWVPRFSTMRGLVEGLVSVSKIDEARELVEMMKKKFPGNVHMWEQCVYNLH